MAEIVSLTSISLVLGGALGKEAFGGALLGAINGWYPLHKGSGLFAAALPAVPRGLDFAGGAGLALSTALAGMSESTSVGGGVLKTGGLKTGGRLGTSSRRYWVSFCGSSAASLAFQGGVPAISAGS